MQTVPFADINKTTASIQANELKLIYTSVMIIVGCDVSTSDKKLADNGCYSTSSFCLITKRFQQINRRCSHCFSYRQ